MSHIANEIHTQNILETFGEMSKEELGRMLEEDVRYDDEAGEEVYLSDYERKTAQHLFDTTPCTYCEGTGYEDVEWEAHPVIGGRFQEGQTRTSQELCACMISKKGYADN